mgnify:CR=1 FL=1
MKFLRFERDGLRGLAVEVAPGEFRGWQEGWRGYPGDLAELIRQGPQALQAAGIALSEGTAIDPDTIRFLPPIDRAGKVICIGLNYADHSAESGFKVPDYPTVFARFNSSLIGHRDAIVRPPQSDTLDYEGELVAIIGKGGRNIPLSSALDHVAGYSIFNDGSIREYQTKTPQWTIGKNFDGTGAFGPYFVAAEGLPPGAARLKLETRLNGQVVQSASTADMIFPVAALVSILSEAVTLEAGDVLVTGTPAGVGLARTPPLYMKPGDICEVEIEGIGTLVNPIAQG